MTKGFGILATNYDGDEVFISQSIIHRIESILWKSSVLVHQVEMPARCRKSLLSNSPATVKRQKYILFDRNVASDAAALFVESHRASEAREIAVAVILFLRLCSFTPSALSALHEFESQYPGMHAHSESVAFCRSISASIDALLNILDSKAKCLALSDVPKNLVFDEFNESEAKFEHSSTWLCSYAATLKLAILERDDSIGKRTKMEQFLNWIHHHFFFTPPLWFVASQFLGVRRQKGIIAGIRTTNTSMLSKHVRNAAWDLNILMEWHQNFTEKRHCVLASRDIALRNVATRLRCERFAGAEQVRRILADDWPVHKDIEYLVGAMTYYQSQLDDPSRPANTSLSRQYYQTLIHSFESQLSIPTIL